MDGLQPGRCQGVVISCDAVLTKAKPCASHSIGDWDLQVKPQYLTSACLCKGCVSVCQWLQDCVKGQSMQVLSTVLASTHTLPIPQGTKCSHTPDELAGQGSRPVLFLRKLCNVTLLCLT